MIIKALISEIKSYLIPIQIISQLFTGYNI